MDTKQLREWESTVDDAAAIGSNLPDGELGTEYIDEPRKWLRAKVIGGAIGGRWGYWRIHSDPLQNKAEKIWANANYECIADKLFNGDAYHFAGMLALPYNGVPGLMWVLIEPRIKEGPPVRYVDPQPLSDGKRYERSKEVYDVATGESEILP